MNCRHCSAFLRDTFLDLGFAPPSNAYRSHSDLLKPETYYPLRVKVCTNCWLVQTEDYAKSDELFNQEYAYFSSTSSSWLEHAKSFVNQMTERFALDQQCFIVEIASNDGYLLRNFVSRGIPCLGIEPTSSTATVAEKIGIPVRRVFFSEMVGKRLACEDGLADLIVGNNVYAHVPDINDFTRGLKALLKPTGVVTLEFQHLMQLIKHNQFDTIYHEHFSYLTLGVVISIFNVHGLRVWDVEELQTHGGSLRIYGCHAEAGYLVTDRVDELLSRELSAGLTRLETYAGFQAKADKVKNDLLLWLIDQKREGRRVAAYGAAAKGNTLLNYAGVKPELLPFVCDAAPAKQGKYLPGSHIPIKPPEVLRVESPDVVLVLAWNIVGEVRQQLADLGAKGVQFATAVPELRMW